MTHTAKQQSIREQLIATKSQRFGKHPVPPIEGLDAELFVRELSAKAVADMTARLTPDQLAAAERAAGGDTSALEEAPRSGFDTLGPWIIAALVDEDQEPVFQDGDEDLVLEVFSMRQATEIMGLIFKVNKISDDVEEEKNG